MISAISGIYMIKNKINNKSYIGSSKDIQNRIRQHWFELRRKTHGNRYLLASVEKYGLENFESSILEICSQENLSIREQFYIDNTSSEYNITREVIRNTPSDESRVLISDTLKEGYLSGRIVSKSKKAVKKYTTLGEFISEYDSLNEASFDSNIHVSTIIRNLDGTYGTAGGFIWRYSDDIREVLPTRRKKERSVTCLNIQTNEKTFYKSYKDVAIALDTTPGSIQRYILTGYIMRKKYKLVHT